MGRRELEALACLCVESTDPEEADEKTEEEKVRHRG